MAFSLIPLIEVAWADWEIQEKEREAVLNAAYARGIEKGSTTCELLENWLKRRPGPEMLETWKHYVGVITSKMDASHRTVFRDGVMAQAKGVAEAAGGFLGFGSRISDAEQKVLDDLAAAGIDRGVVGKGFQQEGVEPPAEHPLLQSIELRLDQQRDP